MGNYTPLTLLALLSLIPLTAYAAWTMRPQRAVLMVAFTATLFGPEGAFIKLPAIPPLDKTNLPYVLLMLVASLKWRRSMERARAWRGIDLLVLLAVFGGFATWQTNMDPLRYGGWRVTHLPALAINDAIQYGLDEIISAGFPFVLGRVFFRTPRDLAEMLHFLTVAGLIQAGLSLVELKMSPQWHIWIYGYGAHSDFLQTIRWGGYRPMNFMAHGLALALFILVSFVSSSILAKIDLPIRKWRPKRIAAILFVALVLCKSTAAILYGAICLLLVTRATPARQARFALVIALIVATYPALRAFDIVPAKEIVELAESAFGADRAESLAFRLVNEESLLEKSRERLWFGWGGHGRSSIYDDELGKEISVADGHWIIVLGLRGVVGMLSSFGLLVFPVFFVSRRLRKVPDEPRARLVAGFAMIVALITFDLIPNGLFATYPYLLAGGLMGVVQELARPGSVWHQPA